MNDKAGFFLSFKHQFYEEIPNKVSNVYEYFIMATYY